jgi:hypothetical protein
MEHKPLYTCTRLQCVPWVTDPAAMVTCERLGVQDTVCRLVAAYLLGVGAALSDSEVPSGHLNTLMLPPWSRVAQRCRVRVGVDYDSDDEAWLRDDIPSLEWAGLAARSSAAVDDAATPAAVPAAHLPPIQTGVPRPKRDGVWLSLRFWFFLLLQCRQSSQTQLESACTGRGMLALSAPYSAAHAWTRHRVKHDSTIVPAAQHDSQTHWSSIWWL